MTRSYNFDNPLWQRDAAGVRVAVTVGNDAPVFMSLVDFCDANCDALNEATNNADGHDVAYKIIDGDELILGGGAAPQVRVVQSVICPKCRVEMCEPEDFEGCTDSVCEAPKVKK